MPTSYSEIFHSVDCHYRGWRLYDCPVEIEPIIQPFDVAIPVETYDDGRIPSPFEYIASKIGSLFKKQKSLPIPDEEDSIYRSETVQYQSLSLAVPKELAISSDASEKLLTVLSFSRLPISFEIVANDNVIQIYASCSEFDKGTVYANLNAYFPDVAIEETEDPFQSFSGTSSTAIIDLGLNEEVARPISMQQSFAIDPHTGLYGLLERFNQSERAAIQIMFQGCRQSWPKHLSYAVTSNDGKSMFLDAPEMPQLAKEKTSAPLFAVNVRLIVQSDSELRTEDLAYQLINGIISSTHSQHNSLIPLSNQGYDFDHHSTCVFTRQSYRTGMLLNSRELVGLVHLPGANIRSSKLNRLSLRSKAAPTELLEGQYHLGNNSHFGQTNEVFVSDVHRTKHTHCIGASGVGKSTFIINSFLQDIDAGNGCVMIDPHGDSVDDVIPRIPENRVNDVILIDPSDADFPIGLNLLQASSETEKIVLASDLLYTFKRHATSWGDTMNSVLANAINAFLESSEGGTLLELRRFLLDVTFRNKFLESVSDRQILSFWHSEFPHLRKGSISPILTRLDTFLRPKIIRNMMAQKEGLDFRKVIDEKKVVLIKLAQGLIGEENSYLLGTLLLAKIYQAALGRQEVSKAERQPIYTYIDECHNFLSPSISAILSGARKYGLGLLLAHQDTSQFESVDTSIGNSVLTNSNIRICFRLGDIDAKKLESGFEYFDRNDLQSLGVGEAIVRVGRSDYDFTIKTRPLSETVFANRYEAIVSNTRNGYATAKDDIEKIVDELYGEVKPRKPIVKTPKSQQEIVDVKESSKEDKSVPNEVETTIKAPIPAEAKTARDEKLNSLLVERERIRDHQYLQNYLRKMAHERGLKADLEVPTKDGGRIDLLVQNDTRKVGIEISVTNTPEYEVRNIRKCLEEGLTKVIMTSANDKHLADIELQAQKTLTKTELSSVKFLLSKAVVAELDTLVSSVTEKEKRVRGYRIKTGYVSAPNAADQTRIVKETIADAVRRKRSE